MSEAKDLAKSMALQAIAMGGTCTGEHGVGVGKKELLRAEVGDDTLSVMRSIKSVLDPTNIMNPGKIFDCAVDSETKK